MKDSSIKFFLNEANTVIIVDFFRDTSFSDIDISKRKYIKIRDSIALNVLQGENYMTQVIYNYQFLYNKLPFYEFFTTCDLIKDSAYLKETRREILIIFSKLKNNKFISPEVAVSRAKKLGMTNIQYQTIDDSYFGVKGRELRKLHRDVWVLKELLPDEKIRTIVLSATRGKLLIDYTEPHLQGYPI
jgi:hypothetical protein